MICEENKQLGIETEENKKTETETQENEPKRTRYICGITYISTQQILEVIQKHKSSILAFAFITHDKDIDKNGKLKEKHIHFVFRLYSAWNPESIRKWFKGYTEFKDGVEMEISTLTQFVKDKLCIVEYLTHENEQDPNQYHYPKSDIYDGGLDELLPTTKSADNSYEIIEKLMYGVRLNDLVRQYGKDFVYHYQHYAFMADQIIKQEDL